MGFEQLWEVEFHTSDVDPKRKTGSGLKSIVMWDPISNTKFANNEPSRPFFKSSQINIFNEELHGDGVQHVALTVADIVSAVRALRGNGVTFMPTPGTYYDMLPDRIAKSGIKQIDEDLKILRELEILVDGNAGRPAVLGRRRLVRVRPIDVIEDRVGAVEAVAGEALLEPQRAVGAAQLDVVLLRHVADLHPVEH
jgi:4-hydroxyphenylpyruvate dioxygenase